MLNLQAHRPTAPPPFKMLSNLIEAIGRDGFGDAVIGFLNEVCGADHFAAFRIEDGGIHQLTFGSIDASRPSGAFVDRYVGDLWRRDPAMAEAQASLTRNDHCNIIHLDLAHRMYADIRPVLYPSVCDRLLMCGRKQDASYSISILRSDPHLEFDDQSIERVATMAEVLVAILAKHADVTAERPNVATALTLLSEIENCLQSMSNLPRREVEVCARILYGMSSVGISLDLGIGEESVKTYRKRAYQRMHIGSERELLTWYLAQWSAWRGCHYKQPAAQRRVSAH